MLVVVVDVVETTSSSTGISGATCLGMLSLSDCQLAGVVGGHGMPGACLSIYDGQIKELDRTHPTDSPAKQATKDAYWTKFKNCLAQATM